MFNRLKVLLLGILIAVMAFAIVPVEHGSGAGGITPHGVVASQISQPVLPDQGVSVADADPDQHGPILWSEPDQHGPILWKPA